MVGGNKVRVWLEGNKKAQQVLLAVVMMGTCMLIGDGVLTPAISGEDCSIT
jgi:KUP system potassium uptake protein